MKLDKSYFQLFFLILFSSVFIFALSKVGVFAFEKAFAEEDIYAERTYIGPVLVEGLHTQEVRNELQKEVSNWQTSSQLFLSYGDEKELIPQESIQFLLEESIMGVQNGVNNPLLVKIDTNQMGTLLSSLIPDTLIDSIGIDNLISAIEERAALLENGEKMIQLLPFINGITEQVWSESTVSSSNLNELSEAFVIQLDPNGKFSFIDGVGSKFPTLSDETLTEIASAVYEASLETNMQVLERQISQERPEGIKLGLEAKIKRDNNIDLILKNPNDFPIKLSIQSLENSQLTARISGYPLNKKFEIRLVEAAEDEKPMFREVVQYSYLLSPGEEKLQKTGKNGELLTVQREIYSANGEKLETETISEDLYLPVNQIVIRSIMVEVEEEFVNDNIVVENDETINEVDKYTLEIPQ